MSHASPSSRGLSSVVLLLVFLTVAGASCPTNPQPAAAPELTGSEPPPAGAPTAEIDESRIEEIQILPTPNRAALCENGRFDVVTIVKFKLSAADVANHYVSVSLIDDEGGIDDLMGNRVFTIPSRLREGDVYTVHTTFPLTCAQDCEVIGADHSGETDPLLKVETSNTGDNMGHGSRATTGGDPSSWPGIQIKCAEDKMTFIEWLMQ